MKNVKVVSATRSPMNGRLWHVALECGHSGWVERGRRPARVPECAQNHGVLGPPARSDGEAKRVEKPVHVTELELSVLRLVAEGKDPWGGRRGVGTRTASQALGRLIRKNLIERHRHDHIVTDAGQGVLRETGAP